MNPIALLTSSPWIAAAAGAGLLCLAVGVQTVRLSDEKADRLMDQREFAIERSNAAQAAAAEMAEYRAEEARRADAQKAIDDETHSRLAAAQADAAAAGLASKRLSDRIAALVASARSAATNSAIAGQREATTDPLSLFADVLGRADARAGLLADYADRARVAGQACERSYKSLTASSTGAP